jgi:hypothetical protein
VIAVVHLVWGPLGPAPLREFLASYRAHPAGVEHELVVLFNGVSDAQRPALMAELEGIDNRLLPEEPGVQDLLAYNRAAQQLEHQRVCFLNSHSRILAADWLAKLDRALDEPRAGLVGASGSWASVHSGVLHSLFLPTPYRGAMPSRAVARAEYQAIGLEQEANRGKPAPVSRAPSMAPVNSAPSVASTNPARSASPLRALAGSVLGVLRTIPPMPQQLLRFKGFPAPHLRTNAFMVDRARFAALQVGGVGKKLDAYALESGRNSFTRQVQRQGLRVLVVDREGLCYEPDRWPLSRTLWQGDQERLLVADNQTRLYANGGIDRRRLLSAVAWGTQADPSPPLDSRPLGDLLPPTRGGQARA